MGGIEDVKMPNAPPGVEVVTAATVTKITLPSVASRLPEEKTWYSFLSGGGQTWLTALLMSPSVVRGMYNVELYRFFYCFSFLYVREVTNLYVSCLLLLGQMWTTDNAVARLFRPRVSQTLRVERNANGEPVSLMVYDHVLSEKMRENGLPVPAVSACLLVCYILYI